MFEQNITNLGQFITSLRGLCLNCTNEKDNHSVRLRTSSQTIGEEGSKPNLNPNPNTNTKPNPKKETKKRNLEKGGGKTRTLQIRTPKLQN